MTHPVEAAVAPLKADAIVRAEQEAKFVIEQVKAELETASWNLEKAAPYPYSGTISRAKYMADLNRRHLFESLVEDSGTNKPYRHFKEPYFVRMSDERIARFIRISKEDAASQYDLFVMKLIGKIGECLTAQLEGNHVWGHSYLHILKAGAVIECWKTQQIVNVSKHNKIFNQWPTRLVK